MCTAFVRYNDVVLNKCATFDCSCNGIRLTLNVNPITCVLPGVIFSVERCQSWAEVSAFMPKPPLLFYCVMLTLVMTMVQHCFLLRS